METLRVIAQNSLRSDTNVIGNRDLVTILL
ncbi:Uncharacterised protein [Streptococcus salivarius]|nr:Uncharacterised protein [Streptococcus salivarius]VUW85517.1 Uncharacterised protein [Streptococcus thermophilus]